MPAVTVIFPDELLERVDVIVAKRKEQSSKPHRSTPAQLHQAHMIAEKEGIAAANKYLCSLRPRHRPSRMGLILELVEHGLLTLAIEEAKEKPAEPVAAKKPRRI